MAKKFGGGCAGPTNGVTNGPPRVYHVVANRAYGNLPTKKPNNVVRFMYENFSSLLPFTARPKKHIK
jgi:hypothetical protein